jgi:hypothetical protein
MKKSRVLAKKETTKVWVVVGTGSGTNSCQCIVEAVSIQEAITKAEALGLTNISKAYTA